MENNYVLGENSINGVKLNDKIRSEELHEFYIVDREDYIESIIGWIPNATDSDKFLMKSDLKMLMSWEDEYILNSNSTNSYLHPGDKQFDEACEEILKINESLK
jgi:hypothetical protein